MKIIEGLKQIKDLQKKAEDIRGKITKHCVHMDYETPMYANQGEQIKEWLQAHSDFLKEILRLRVAIQRTNLATEVTIELGGKNVIKNIAEWIHRRRDLATSEFSAWRGLNDRGLKEGSIKTSAGEIKEAKIVRYFDPKERDNRMALYDSEPTIVDSKLEIVNAVTDLIEN